MEITSLARFIPYFENIRSRTMRVIGSIPREQYDWRPAPGMFSFADLIRHLAAIERYMFCENVQGLPSRYPGHGEELAKGPEEVLAYIERMHEESIAILKSLSDEDLSKPCTTPGGATMPRWKWLRAMIEHEAHHRGQIFMMLRMIGIGAAPLYGLTSEEVRDRSVV